MDGATMRSMNLKQQIFNLVVLALVMTACSSSPKKDSSSDDVSADSAATGSESGKSNVAKGMSIDDSSAVAKGKASEAQIAAMNEALKSQNDDAIQKTAMAVLLQNAKDVRAMNAMGIYYLRKNRPLAAQLFFSNAIQIQPSSSELYSNLGLSYLAMKEETKAILSFKKAVELNPADTNAASNLGAIYVSHRDFNKAFAILSMNTGRSKDVKFINNFAIACAETGKVEQAESLYQDALKLSPNNKELTFNYATLQIDYLNKYKEGLETLGRLKLVGPVEGMRNQMNELENRAKAGLK
jgi:Flp pilus assembly protein TadD